MSLHTISLRADQLRTRTPQWLVGMLADSSLLNDHESAVNADPQAVDVWTVLVASVTNSFEYVLTFDGVTVSYTSDGSASKAEIADGLAEAINTEPVVRGRFEAVSDGVDTIVITGLQPADVTVLTDNTADLTTTHTTTADEADPIPFGRLIMSAGFDDGARLCRLAASSGMTAQVDTLTIDYAANEVYLIDITIEGVTYKFAVNADTDDATTSAAIFNAINARMPANSVVATNPAATSVVLTGEVAGKVFVTSVGTESATVANLSLAHTTVGTDVNDALGVSLHTYDEEDTARETDEIVYPANAGVHYARKARVAVEQSAAVTDGGAVYVELGVAADNGQFFASSSATRVLYSRAKWERNEDSSANDDVAVLRIAIP